ncbi:MAG: hypothetical protein ACK4K1_08280 [Flavobacterium sp.]
MKNNFKFFGLYLIISSLIFITFWLITGFVIPEIKTDIKAGIVGGLTALFSPKFKIINTQIGKKVQINWSHLKKVVQF